MNKEQPSHTGSVINRPVFIAVNHDRDSMGHTFGQY